MILQQILQLLPASVAHDLAPLGLRLAAEIQKPIDWEFEPLKWNSLFFRNRLGIAGGVDKNAEYISHWEKLGAGFVEVGTVTPVPQKPNPGNILDRDWKNKNLWNKMGFPNEGMKEVEINLNYTQRSIPVFLNLGKNRNTANEKAIEDYLLVVKQLQNQVDAFVVNVSSPNTKGLRDLQNKKSLYNLTSSVIKNTKKPVLVKLSPDLTDIELKESTEACAEAGISGFILTNTTLARPDNCYFPKEGGLSGADLAQLSKLVLKNVIQTLGTNKSKYLLVSAGGIQSARDAKERLDLGADLVQFYAALVFQGPAFFKKTITQLREGSI